MTSRKDELRHQRIRSMVEQGGYAELAPRHTPALSNSVKIGLTILGAMVLVEVPPPIPLHWSSIFSLAHGSESEQNIDRHQPGRGACGAASNDIDL